MAERSAEDALIISAWPSVKAFDATCLTDFELATKIVSGVRNFRKERNLPQKDTLSLYVVAKAEAVNYHALIQKMAGVDQIHWVDAAPGQSGASFRVGTLECFIPLEGSVDMEAEKAKLEEELRYAKGFLQSVRKKLENERFVNNAPENVIAMERKKEADALEKISLLEKSLSAL